MPAIFASFIIVAGQLVLNTAQGSCGYDLACKTDASLAQYCVIS